MTVRAHSSAQSKAALWARRKEDPDKRAAGDGREWINALLADWEAGTGLMRVGCC